MSHRHYCDVEGHNWQCANGTCACICNELMEGVDHSECPVELRACPEHQRQLPVLSDDELSDFFGDLTSDAEKPRCECGCADAHREAVVGYCVWCSHVYVSYDTKTEAQHFLYFCPGAPAELRDASQSKLARLD
jgi:hypothetical protein